MKILRCVLLVIIPVLFLASCKVSINENFFIKDGEKTSGSKNTVNGKIRVGDNVVVNGECRSINGRIDIGSNSRVKDLVSVNGDVSVGKDAVVKGDIQLVNGNVYCETGAKVTGCVGTINGKIIMKKTSVEEDLSTYNGNIELSENTVVSGDIVVKERHGGSSDYHELKIEIDDSLVEGSIINEEPDVEVIVFLSHGGIVKGRVVNAKVIER